MNQRYLSTFSRTSFLISQTIKLSHEQFPKTIDEIQSIDENSVRLSLSDIYEQACSIAGNTGDIAINTSGLL